MMLIELASHQGSSAGPGSPHAQDQADGPIELITRLPLRWRARHSDEAMRALARAWSGLSWPMRSLAVSLGRDRWLGVAQELASDPDPGARLAALSIAHDTADPGLARVVGGLLGDEQQAVRKSADAAMLRMTMLMLDHLPQRLLGENFARVARATRVALPADPAVLALERCILLAAIADAAWSFATHRCRSPLIAALLLMDRAVATAMERQIGDRMRRLLSERNHPSHAPLRSVLKRTPCPILRDRALRWLTIAPIAGAALERLSIADSLDEHEIVLRRAHLAIRPARASRLASLKAARTTPARGQATVHPALPEAGDWERLGETSRLGVLRMLWLVPMGEPARRALAEPALGDASPRVRLIACERCPALDLSDYLYDANPFIARHAALRWSSAGHTPPRPGSPAWSHRARVGALNARSPHAWVRRVSADEADRISPSCPRSPASRSQARRMLVTDPTGFVRLVRDHLADPDQRLDALMLIRLLGVETRFELDLISLVQHSDRDPHARATAVMALARVDSDSARYILREAMGDRDPRTRANAVESADAPPEQILELKHDEHHRVRANAIRRGLRDPGRRGPPCTGVTRDAGRALLEMLGDARDEHRLAGAWAAQRSVTVSGRDGLGTAFEALVERIEDLSANDTDPRVRTRAGLCVHRLGEDFKRRRRRMDHAILDQLRDDQRA